MIFQTYLDVNLENGGPSFCLRLTKLVFYNVYLDVYYFNNKLEIVDICVQCQQMKCENCVLSSDFSRSQNSGSNTSNSEIMNHLKKKKKVIQFQMFQNIQPQLILHCQFPPVQRGLNMSWCHVFNSFIQRVAKVPLRQGEFLPQTSQQGMIWGTGCVLLPCSLVTDSGAVLCHEEQRALKDVLNLSLASVFNIHFN